MVAKKRAIKALPPIPRDATPEMRQLLTALAENARILGDQGKGSRLDAAVTFRDIGGVANAGTLSRLVAEYSAIGGLDPSVLAETPTAPVGVVISGSDTAVVIGWTEPKFKGYWYTQIYRTTWDGTNLVAFDEAFAIGQVAGVFMDLTVSQNTDYIYWLRHVNTEGVRSPLSQTAGHTVKTLESLDYKKGWITQDRLEADLKSRIDLIDTATLFGTDGGLLGLFENDLSVLGQLKQETIDAQIAAVDAAALAEAEQLEAAAAALAARNDALATAADVIEAAASKDAAALSATNASGSAAAAAVAKTDAAGSATAALAAKNDAASSKTAAAASATAAAGSASAALSAKTAAEGSASSAAAFADAAEGSADAALSAQTEAEGAASLAVASATASADSAAAALVAKNTAENKAGAAATSATSASTSATAAANSASAALTAKNDAATSATNAATSANTATTKASSATASATAAADSASAALVSKNSAATSETNAAGSKTAAANSASSAAASATSAADSATAAISAKNSASTSETNAATSATTATNKASAASASATAAAGSASAALTAQNSASSSATAADGSKTSAASSASSATASATAAAGSASAALASKNAAATSATAADGSKTSAATSAAAALAASTAADGSASAALASKTSAATSATNAANSATTATNKAAEAVISAQTAADKATLAQQVALRLHNIDNTNNLVDTGEWVIGTSGSQSGTWLQNGGTSENAIVAGQGPYGSTALWQCTSDGVNDASGGFSRTFTVNPAKTYRYVLWFKKPSSSGSYYFGCSQSTTETLAGAFNNNPYFTSGGRPSAVPADSWFCVVGYVYAAGTTVDSYTDSGIYTADGQRIGGVTNYRIKAGSTTQLIRAYQYYSTTLGAQQWMCEPRVEEVSGAVPLSTLFGSLAAVQARMTATENEAYYSLKVQANGKVAGFGVTSNPSGTAILFRADQFGVTNGSDSLMPFSVRNNLVYINDARISQLQANKIFNVGSVDSPDAGLSHLGNTFIEGAFIMGKTGQIKHEYLDPAFRDRLVLTDPDAVLTGGTRSKTVSATNTVSGVYLASLTGTDANGNAPINSGGATTVISMRAIGGTTGRREANTTTYEPKCLITFYRKREGAAAETIGAYQFTGTAKNLVAAGEPIEHQAYIDQTVTVTTPPPVGGSRYEYYFTVRNVSGTWAIDADGNIIPGGTITVTVSENIGSSGGVLVESLASAGTKYFTVNDGGIGRGASVTAGGLYVASYSKMIANSSGQVFDNGNRVYSAGNNNIGTGAFNYAAGDHSHSYLPLGGGSLTGDVESSAAVRSRMYGLSGSVNFDSITKSGFYNLYSVSGGVNAPLIDAYGTMLVLGSEKAGATFANQIAFNRMGEMKMYVRGMNDGANAWSSWQRVVFYGQNIGTGSTNYAAGDHNHYNGYVTASYVNGYRGLTGHNDSTSDWVRTTVNGIIPYQSGGASSLGTSSWPFNNAYVSNITGSGTVDFSKFWGNAADSVSAPSFSWTGDTNTGMYWVAADQVGITTGGVQRALFNSNGVTVTGTTKILSTGSVQDATTATYLDGLTIEGGNQRMVVDVSSVTNGGGYIQMRHQSTTYPSSYYTLALNPLGGAVTINNNTAYHTGNLPDFIRADQDDSFLGKLVSSARDGGIYGTYDSYKTDHIWSIGVAYKNAADGSNFGNLYGLAYKHTNNATGGTMAGGHQIVWCENGVPKAALGTNIWTSGTVTGSSFIGNINASSLNTGTVPDARISGSYTGMVNLTGSGTVDFAKFLGNAGDSAAAPSFSWTGDTNTGIYQPAADQVGIAAGGAWAGTFTSTVLTLNRLSSIGTGNDYNTGGVEIRGNGSSNTVFPTLGFHQPGMYASSLQLRGAADFRFYAQGGSAYANVTAGTFNGALNGNASTASSTPLMTADSTAAFGRNGLQYANFSGVGGTGASGTQFNNPTNDWWHHIIMNHGNSVGYYTDIATCFHSNSIKFKRVSAGTHTGWMEIYHEGHTPTPDEVGALALTGGTLTGTLNAQYVSGLRFAAGYDAGQSGSFSCSNWFRSSGNTGWYSQTHGGGIYMLDGTWVRTYGTKKFYVDNSASDAIYTAGGVRALGQISAQSTTGVVSRVLTYDDFLPLNAVPAGLEGAITASWIGAGAINARHIQVNSIVNNGGAYTAFKIAPDAVRPLALSKVDASGIEIEPIFYVDIAGNGFFAGKLSKDTVDIESIQEAARRQIYPYYLGTQPGSSVSNTTSTSMSSSSTFSLPAVNSIGGNVNLGWSLNAFAHYPSSNTNLNYSKPVWKVEIFRGTNTSAPLVLTKTYVGTESNDFEAEDEFRFWSGSASLSINDQFSDTSAAASQVYTMRVTRISGTPTTITRRRFDAASPAFLTNTLEQGSSGYWRDKETGMMIQWGTLSMSGNSSQSVSFPTAFPTFCVSVQVNMQSDTFGNRDGWGSRLKSKTGFTIVNGIGNTETLDWVAFGY